MAARRHVMFLVDVDNVSPQVIEQAFEAVMAEFGAVHVRRAYCTADHAQQHANFFKRLLLRPMVNLAVGKNSSDIALAVDAIDLAHIERPDVIVIVSSDSDFTPLVGRLREKGATVRGFGQLGKTGEGVQLAYDQYTNLSHAEARRPARAQVQAPAPAPMPVPVPAPAPVKSSSGRRDAAKPADKAAAKPAAKRAPARKTAPAPTPPPAPAPALPPEVEAILHAVPGLRRGDKIELGEAAHALRVAELLGKTAASTRLFRKHAGHFLLSPERQPNKVQFVTAPARP